MRTPLRIYVWSVIAVGSAVLAASAVTLATGPYRYEWLLFVALAVVTGSFNINVGSTDASISVADTFFITCALLYGPAAAAVAIAVDSLVLSLLRRRHGLARALFNTLSLALSMFAAAHAFFAMAHIGPLAGSHAPITSLILPLMVLAILYFALNCGLVASVSIVER